MLFLHFSLQFEHLRLHARVILCIVYHSQPNTHNANSSAEVSYIRWGKLHARVLDPQMCSLQVKTLKLLLTNLICLWICHFVYLQTFTWLTWKICIAWFGDFLIIFFKEFVKYRHRGEWERYRDRWVMALTKTKMQYDTNGKV